MSLSNRIRKRNLGVILAVIILLLILVTPAAAITWGHPDNGTYKNVGLATVLKDPRCSGTLIHPRVFLTAGHCTIRFELLKPNDLHKLKVSFNNDNAIDDDLLDVANVITHPHYNDQPASNPYDLGVVILAEPVDTTTISPANLPPEGYLDTLKAEGKLVGKGSNRAEFTLVGYGFTVDSPPPTKNGPDGGRWVAESEYLALSHALLTMLQNNKATGKGGTCMGDSGGPAFYTTEDGTEYLVGVTSSGDENCIARGDYYRTDIPDAMNFITDVINNLPPLER